MKLAFLFIILNRVEYYLLYSSVSVVYLLIDNSSNSLMYHKLELNIAENLDSSSLQARACANLGLTQVALGQYEEAIRLQEQSLSLAAAAGGDQSSRIPAFSNLGRLHHFCGNLSKSLSYLQSGLSLSEGISIRKDEIARLRHRLDLVHWQAGDNIIAIEQLEKAANSLETFDSNGATSIIISPSKKINLLTDIYENLQKILVLLNKPEESLNLPERSRNLNNIINNNTTTHYSDIINRQKGIELYYSQVGND